MGLTRKTCAEGQGVPTPMLWTPRYSLKRLHSQGAGLSKGEMASLHFAFLHLILMYMFY